MTSRFVKSRFPQIIAELPPRADAAAKAVAESVERDAKQRVPDRPPVGEGLVAAIHTERDGAASYRVVAGDDEVFYGHMVEHGTVHSAPHPFLVPATEAHQGDVALGIASAAFRGL